MRAVKPLTFGSLFAGIGGMDLGLERAGLTCAWQVEIDDYANRVLQKHWPSIPRWRDVRTFPPEPVDDWRVWLLAGGFPCTQTSTAAAIQGRRAGLAGPNSGLWYEMLRVIETLRPEWVVVENPTGAKTWAETIEGGLADAGYGVQRHENEAADFGAFNRRRRVFWIANRHGQRLALARPERPSTADTSARGAADGNPWLSSLAGVLRVDDGHARGMDRRERITAIGNTCCPAQAEDVARRILAQAPPPRRAEVRPVRGDDTE